MVWILAVGARWSAGLSGVLPDRAIPPPQGEAADIGHHSDVLRAVVDGYFQRIVEYKTLRMFAARGCVQLEGMPGKSIAGGPFSH